jgi:RNA polymerase sigma factor (sigma-70 family)
VNRVAYIGQEHVVSPEPLRLITDAEVIASAQEDPRLLRPLFDRHFVAIHRYLHRRVGLDLADDLASETFLVAIRSRGRYDLSQDDARPWLFGIATNLLRRHRRTERRRFGAYIRAARDGLAQPDPEMEVVEDRVDAMAAKPRLAQAMLTLTPADRDVLFLYAWADLSYGEIARAMGIPIGTVRSRLARARKLVRELLCATGQVLDEGPEGANDE